MKKNIVIFTDGSSRGNPGPGGWGAVIVESLKSKVKSIETVRELGGRENHTTNNRMELSGVINALSSVGSLASKFEEAVINTDSAYVVNGITKWVYGWQKNGWKKANNNPNIEPEDVLNKDLWEELVNVSKGKKIKWNLIPGHSGVPGNERCDEIATAFADNKKTELFNGRLSDYEVDILNLKGGDIKNGSTSLTTRKIKSKKPAYSYLSFVNGVFKKHKDWASCEKEVKGIKGNIKYKKTFSEEDEREVKRSWGVK